MKKILILLMALCMSFSLFGCGADNNGNNSGSNGSNNSNGGGNVVDESNSGSMGDNANDSTTDDGTIKDGNGIIGDENAENNQEMKDQAEKDHSTAEYANDAQDKSGVDTSVKEDVKE